MAKSRGPDLPEWMKGSLYDQQGSVEEMNRRFDLGSADSDQYAASMSNLGYRPGFVERPGEISPGFHSPKSGYQPAAGMAGINAKGEAGDWREPSKGERVQRALKGALTGPDVGSKAGNVAFNVGANALGPAGRVGRSVAGAIQGARDTSPSFQVAGNAGNEPTSRPTALGNLPTGGNAGLTTLGGLETSRQPVEERFADAYVPSKGQRGTQEALPTEEEPIAAPEGQFTGGSGSPVSAYALPEEDDLASYLANASRYEGYDPSSGRVGVAGGGLGGYAGAGFDFAQDPGNRDIGKSAKYALAFAAERAAQAGIPMPRTKAEAEQWFTQNVSPLFNQLGFTVHEVVGDKARVTTRESAGVYPEGVWVDFLIGADGDNPMIGWQDETMGGGGAQGAALQGALSDDPFESRVGALGVADTGNPALDSYAQQIVNMLLQREALDGAMDDGSGTFQRRYDRLRSFA